MGFEIWQMEVVVDGSAVVKIVKASVVVESAFVVADSSTKIVVDALS